jgi:hypothetical protein
MTAIECGTVRDVPGARTRYPSPDSRPRIHALGIEKIKISVLTARHDDHGSGYLLNSGLNLKIRVDWANIFFHNNKRKTL